MKKVYIAGVDCSISDAIKYAIEGNGIIVPEEKNGNPSLELINFSTMHRAKALNPTMIENIIEEYRGNESVLLYLRTKLSEMGIQTYQFDENMFSTYERDINGNETFISPTEFFDDLEKTIDKGNNNLIAFALGKTEKVLGINSVGISNYISSISEEKEYPAVM